MGEIKTMARVNLFVVGQPKSGTTALYFYLTQHPDISMLNLKEPRVFSADMLYPIHMTKAKYEKEAATYSTKYIGEATADYLFSKEAAGNIKQYNKHAKCIVILRDPATFIVSYHSQQCRDEQNIKRNVPPLRYLLENPKTSKDPSQNYKEWINYTDQLKRFFKVIPKEQVLIIFQKNLLDHQQRTLDKIWGFLSVNKIKLAPIKSNISGVYRNEFLKKIHKISNCFPINRVKKYVRTFTPPKHLVKLKNTYRSIILKSNVIKSPDWVKDICSNEVKRLSTFLRKDLLTFWDYKNITQKK
ncbi:MAG: hypothetical protein ACI8Y7_000529 [Candidatus Woesearchaeota archaeon]|jgi:hypothetical protein